MKLYISEKHQHHLEKQMLLIKLVEGSEAGVSSLLSWPHLGDPSLFELKSDLLGEQKNGLVQKALYFATKDLQQENLKSLQLPQSHKLVLDENLLEKTLNAKKIKLKPKGNFKDLAEKLNTLKTKPKSLRIDFNNKLSYHEFHNFLSLCNAHTLKSLDFIEDPFTYNDDLWAAIKSDFPNVRLALDHNIGYNRMCFDYYIWKPAKSFYHQQHCQIIPTHYMSDEVEWHCSLWEASEHEGMLEQFCGFGTEHLNLGYEQGDDIEIKKHWNYDISQLAWNLVSENFQLAFNFS